MSYRYRARFEAVFLCCHPLGPLMTVEDAARYTGQSVHSVNKWADRYIATNDVDDVADYDLLHTNFAKDTERKLVEFFVKHSSTTVSLEEVQEALSRRFKIYWDIMRIKSCLENANLIETSDGWIKQLLPRNHIRRRLILAKEIMTKDTWGDVVFAGRTLFSTRIRSVCRSARVAKVYAWGCFNFSGFGRLYLSTSKITGRKMERIYEACLMKSVSLFRRLRHRTTENWKWKLQEHSALKNFRVIRWKDSNDISEINWPSSSLDLNPINNVWRYIRIKLREKRPRNVKQLCTQIRTIWRTLPVSYSELLVESMDERCRQLVQAKGDLISF